MGGLRFKNEAKTLETWEDGIYDLIGSKEVQGWFGNLFVFANSYYFVQIAVLYGGVIRFRHKTKQGDNLTKWFEIKAVEKLNT